MTIVKWLWLPGVILAGAAIFGNFGPWGMALSYPGGSLIGISIGLTLVDWVRRKHQAAADAAWAASMSAMSAMSTGSGPVGGGVPFVLPAGVGLTMEDRRITYNGKAGPSMKGKLFIFGDGKILLALDGTEISHGQFQEVKRAMENWQSDPGTRSMIIAGVEVEIITPEVRDVTVVLSE